MLNINEKTWIMNFPFSNEKDAWGFCQEVDGILEVGPNEKGEETYNVVKIGKYDEVVDTVKKFEKMFGVEFPYKP